MADRAPLSARERFVAASRARAKRRARRLRGGTALVALLSFAGGASMRAAEPAQASTQIVRAASATIDIPPPVVVPVTASDVESFVAQPGIGAELRGPSFLAGVAQRDRMRATLCLASAIYYEAATEPDEGQRAVAQVVLNRVRHPAWPKTVCGVVYQGSDRPGCQFSFACDGAMARGPMLAYWIRARRVAEAALNGETYAPVGSATFYHTLQVSPAWGARMTPVGIIGAHIFYRMPSDAPQAAALPFAYRGNEPTPGPLPRVVPPAELMTISVPVLPPAPVAVAPLLPANAQPAVARVAPSRDSRYVAGALPDSDVLPQYRDSGKWIAPAR